MTIWGPPSPSCPAVERTLGVGLYVFSHDHVRPVVIKIRARGQDGRDNAADGLDEKEIDLRQQYVHVQKPVPPVVHGVYDGDRVRDASDFLRFRRGLI